MHFNWHHSHHKNVLHAEKAQNTYYFTVCLKSHTSQETTTLFIVHYIKFTKCLDAIIHVIQECTKYGGSIANTCIIDMFTAML